MSGVSLSWPVADRADNVPGEPFGFDRTAETIRQACVEGLSAEATIDRILETIGKTFRIMGLLKVADLYDTEVKAVQALGRSA